MRKDCSIPGELMLSASTSETLEWAEHIAMEKGTRFTPLRRLVLACICSHEGPVKPYDLLAQLGTTRDRIAPPTVYRVLHYLEQLGVIHKLESLNAYVACTLPCHEDHHGQFLICSHCNDVLELDESSVVQKLGDAARSRGFNVSSETIEIQGVCRNCR